MSQPTSLKPNPLTNEMSKARIALFNYTPETPDDTKTYPLMKGFIESRDFKVDLAGFEAVAEESGTRYLSLSIGTSDMEKIYGRLFRETKPGKEGQYFGIIEKSRDTGAIDGSGRKVYESVWKLGISAKKAVAESGTKYIAGEVYVLGRARQMADAETEDVAF